MIAPQRPSSARCMMSACAVAFLRKRRAVFSRSPPRRSQHPLQARGSSCSRRPLRRSCRSSISQPPRLRLPLQSLLQMLPRLHRSAHQHPCCLTRRRRHGCSAPLLAPRSRLHGLQRVQYLPLLSQPIIIQPAAADEKDSALHWVGQLGGHQPCNQRCCHHSRHIELPGLPTHLRCVRHRWRALVRPRQRVALLACPT